MTALDIAVTLLVLFGLFVLGYCKVTNKTMGDLIKEIREVFRGEVEETRL